MSSPTLDGFNHAKGAIRCLTDRCVGEAGIHRGDVITAMLAHALDMAHEESRSPDPAGCLHEILEDLNQVIISRN